MCTIFPTMVFVFECVQYHNRGMLFVILQTMFSLFVAAVAAVGFWKSCMCEPKMKILKARTKRNELYWLCCDVMYTKIECTMLYLLQRQILPASGPVRYAQRCALKIMEILIKIYHLRMRLKWPTNLKSRIYLRLFVIYKIMYERWWFCQKRRGPMMYPIRRDTYTYHEW